MNYSPWTDAAQSFSGVGNNISNVAMRMAELKAQQNYKQQMASVAVQKMMEQAQLRDAQQKMDEEHASLFKAETAKQQGIIDAAMRAGIAARGQVPLPDPVGMPSRGNGQALQIADLMQALTQGKALQGGINPFETTQVGANATSFNRVTGQPLMNGPMVLPQGSMYQLPGQASILNPRPFVHNVPAGAIAIDQTGQTLANNPAMPGNQMSGLGSVLNFISTAQKPTELGDVNPMQTTPMYTNATQLANTLMQHLQGTVGPQVAPAQNDSFDSESAARSAGKKAGDVIQLKGVGKVRLK